MERAILTSEAAEGLVVFQAAIEWLGSLRSQSNL
jgi:hypothetical protein